MSMNIINDNLEKKIICKLMNKIIAIWEKLAELVKDTRSILTEDGKIFTYVPNILEFVKDL